MPGLFLREKIRVRKASHSSWSRPHGARADAAITGCEGQRAKWSKNGQKSQRDTEVNSAQHSFPQAESARRNFRNRWSRPPVETKSEPSKRAGPSHVATRAP